MRHRREPRSPAGGEARDAVDVPQPHRRPRWLVPTVAVLGTALVAFVVLGRLAGDHGGRPFAAGASPATTSCGVEIPPVPGSGGNPDNPFLVVLGINAIPAITHPQFESPAASRRWLPGSAPVVVVGVGADVRAYPLAILEWHEVVDDVVGGQPLAVTYCPLCNSAAVYSRRLGRRVISLETSGALENGALVLIDPSTRQLWLQPVGASYYPGPPLGWLPSNLLSLDEAAADYPGLRVLDRNTGYQRDYTASPYGGVGGPGQPLGLYRGFYDTRIDPKTRVSGVVLGGRARAWQYPALRRVGVRDDRVGGVAVLVVFHYHTSGIGYSDSIEAAPDVGSTDVFLRTVRGKVLSFRTLSSGLLTDGETGTVWNGVGRAVRGPLAGAQLTPVRHLDMYWWTWAAFYPGSSLWPPAPRCVP